MDTIAYLLPSLGCVAMMGGMVWMMTRNGQKPDPTDQDRRQRELDSLREELQTLRNGPTAHLVENDRG